MKKNKETLPFFGIPKLLPYIRPYRKMTICMIILGIGVSLADSLYPLFHQYALDHFILPGTLSGLPSFILMYFGLMVIQQTIDLISLFQGGRLEMLIDRDLRDASFHHLQTLSFAYYNQNNVGYIHARVLSDTGKIGELISWRFMDIVWNVSYIVFIFVVMFAMNAHLAFCVLIFVPVIVCLILFFQKRLVFFNRIVRELNARITGHFDEGITGIKSIKTLVIEKTQKDLFHEDSHQMVEKAVKVSHHSALLTSLVTMVSSFALAVVLWQGGILTTEAFMQIGTLSVFMSYAVGLLSPIQELMAAFSALVAIQVNIERYSRLLEEVPNVKDNDDVIEKYGDAFNPKKENWEELHGDIEFKDVTFMYPDGKENVLEHFDLKVEQGTNVAIVGQTGAGKSTLVNLVCRFYEPTEGQILIDGKDVRQRSQLWLHSHLGYVLQNPLLFSGTVRENLKYGNAFATDAQIWHALEKNAADTIVRRFDQGLDSQVGEGGDRLSTGEKQLLSITRAVLADPKILILDEATSSVDTITEKKIQQAIRAVIKGRTSFVIAHRLSTIVDADIILVVHDGKIVEKGTHAQLMKQKGEYFQLYTRQYEDWMEV